MLYVRLCYDWGMEYTTITIRIDTDMKDKLKKAAIDNRRSVSSLVILAIEDYFKETSSWRKNKFHIVITLKFWFFAFWLFLIIICFYVCNIWLSGVFLAAFWLHIVQLLPLFVLLFQILCKATI